MNKELLIKKRNRRKEQYGKVENEIREKLIKLVF